MGTASKRFLNTLTAQAEPGAISAEPPTPTGSEVDCLIGRLEVALAPPAPQKEGMPNTRRDPYQFD